MAGLDALFVAGGVTDAVDARHASGGVLAVTGPSPADIRTGVLAGPGSTALVTGTAATGPMTVAIAPHVAVTTRGTANGAYLGPTLDAATTVTVTAAPGSGSRIDVVYARQRDTTSGIPSPDASPGPEYGVLAGQVSTGTPVKPDLSTIAGAEELATVTVAAGATATNGAGVTITQTARQTVARGAPIPVRSQTERNALTTGGAGYPGLSVKRLDATGCPIEEYDGATWRRYTFDDDTGWTGTITVGGAYTANGTPIARRIGRVVYGLNGVSNAGLAINSNYLAVMTISAGFRPDRQIYQLAGISSGAATGVFVINTDGTVDLRTGPTLSSYYRLDPCSWLTA